VSDLELWEIVRSGSDPFEHVGFREALQSHPLRVEAWIQQPLVRALVQVLGKPLTADIRLDEVAKRAFCERNAALRQESGGLTVDVLARSTEVSMEALLELLSSILVSSTGVSLEVRNAILDDREPILAAAQESSDLAHQAELASPDVDRDGWRSIARSYAMLSEAFAMLLSNDPDTYGATEVYGLVEKIMESWRVPSGHRAPYGEFAKAQYWRMGGRVW
jgi:hypothetical protein